ncbi:unnamed protein product [Caenorhabditis nigoni]
MAVWSDKAIKTRIGRMTNMALTVMREAQDFCTGWKAGVLKAEDSKTDCVQKHSDVVGSINSLEGLEKWIMEKIDLAEAENEEDVEEEDEVKEKRERLQLLLEYGETKHVKSTVLMLQTVRQDMESIMDSQDDWQNGEPTSPEEFESRWETMEDREKELRMGTPLYNNNESLEFVTGGSPITPNFGAGETKGLSMDRMAELEERMMIMEDMIRYQEEGGRGSKDTKKEKEGDKVKEDKKVKKEKEGKMEGLKGKKGPKPKAVEDSDSDLYSSNEEDEDLEDPEMDTTASESSEDEKKAEKEWKKDKKGGRLIEEKKMKTRFLKMKPIELKKFDGSDMSKYKDWKTMFMEGYGKDPRMSKLNKLIQLKGLVTGLAEDLLEGIELENSNYELAWNVLDENFEKPARPLLALERKFDQMKVDQKNFFQMRNDTSKLNAVIANMKNRGMVIDSPMVYDRYIRKFPNEVAEKLIVKTLSESFNGNFSKIQKWTMKILNAKVAIEENKAELAGPKDFDVNKVHHLEIKEKKGEQGTKEMRGNNRKDARSQETRSITFLCERNDVSCVSPTNTSLGNAVRYRNTAAVHAKKLTTPASMTPFRRQSRTEDRICKEEGDVNTSHQGTMGFVPKETMDFVPKMAEDRQRPPVVERRAELNRVLLTSITAPKGAQEPATVVGSNEKEEKEQVDAKDFYDKSKVHTITENEKTEHNKSIENIQDIPDSLVYSITNDNIGEMAYILLNSDKGDITALIDTGANCCLVSEQLAQSRKLTKVKTVKMRLRGIGSVDEYDANVYTITVNGHTITARGYGNLNTPTRVQRISRTEFDELKKQGVNTERLRKLLQKNGKDIDMIIGTNVIWDLLKTAESKKFGNQKTIICTKIGDFIIPTNIDTDTRDSENKAAVFYNENEEEDYMIQLCKEEDEEESAQSMLEKLWSLNAIGIKEQELEEDDMSEMEEALAEFKRTAQWEDGKLLVKLPLNGNEAHLANNLPVAMKRLSNQVGRLMYTPEVLEEYDGIINKQLCSDIIEICEDTPPDTKCYYIPHQTVEKKDSNTTKRRVVLDASSHGVGKLSLNQCVRKLPSLLNLLTGIVLRSRTGQFYMTSDIEKAFHQIRLQMEDRDYTRFVWLKDWKKGAVQGNFVTYRFKRIPFGMACSPFLLAASILTYMERYPAEINKKIEENLYVDNLLFLTNKEEELPGLYEESKKAAVQWGMNLREYQTNSEKTRDKIPIEDRAPDKPNKMLGMLFDAKNDTLTLNIPSPPEGVPSKRELQSFLARIYDPLGVVSPITVRLKLFIQSLWKTNTGWKEKIPKGTVKIWEAIKKEYQDTQYIMKRQLTERYDFERAKLIIFSDASKSSFGVAAYVRYEYTDGSVSTKLLMSKSRVKPLKNGERLTVPKTELLALAMATNVAVYLQKELHNSIQFESVEFFSDSMIALGWTVTTKKLKMFVNNRVRALKANCKLLEDQGIEISFHHVETKQNPSDYTTRGQSTSDLFRDPIVSVLWSGGPAFLMLPTKDWPQSWTESTKIPKWLEKAMAEEIVGKEGKLVYEETDGVEEYVAQLTTASAEDPKEYHSIVPYESTNSLSRLTRIMGTVMKAVQRFAAKTGRKFQGRTMKAYCAAKTGIEGYEKRRKTVLYYMIADHYKETAARAEYRVPADLNPKQDQFGLIRKGTRLEKSELAEDTKYPIILVRDHKLTEMIVRQTHVHNRHIGTEHLLAECRRQYWIPQGRQIARKIVHSCVTCRKLRGRPFKYPNIPPLPSTRVRRSGPFQNVGLDGFGPLIYKGLTGERKCWVLICTCLITRNVHLELISDNGTTEFVLAMRRYFARRGTPRTVVLDNAKSFVLGSKIFNNDIRKWAEEGEAFTNFLDQHPIEWNFITPLSPWKGGVYERIIGIVKKLLYASGDTAQFNYVQLFTILTEIEGIVNSRPISHNPEGPNDGDVIRPVDFINPEVKLGVLHDPGNQELDEEMGTTEKETRLHLSNLNKHMNHLWLQWETMYLTQLKESQTKRKHYTNTTPKVGQVVLMEERLRSKHKWQLAKITAIHPNAQGQIRTVTVKYGGMEVLRSVNQLIPLELEEDSTATEKAEQKTENTTEPEPLDTTESQERTELFKQIQERIRKRLDRRAKQGVTYHDCDVAKTLDPVLQRKKENKESREPSRTNDLTKEVLRKIPSILDDKRFEIGYGLFKLQIPAARKVFLGATSEYFFHFNDIKEDIERVLGFGAPRNLDYIVTEIIVFSKELAAIDNIHTSNPNEMFSDNFKEINEALPVFDHLIKSLLSKGSRSWEKIRDLVYKNVRITANYLVYKYVSNSLRWISDSHGCEQIVAYYLPLPSIRVFIRNHFDKGGLKDVDKLVEDIRSGFIDMIEKSKWIHEKTRNGAIRKAKAMKKTISYPPELEKPGALDEHFNVKMAIR